MNKNILLYDVFDDNKDVLNSQVILDNNIGFEIPKNYYFNKESTDLKNHILHIKSDKDFIRLYYEKCNEYSYKEKIEEIMKKYGKPDTYTLIEIPYRRFRSRSANAKHGVMEYLFFIEKEV